MATFFTSIFCGSLFCGSAVQNKSFSVVREIYLLQQVVAKGI
jgi:hypothetical protein